MAPPTVEAALDSAAREDRGRLLSALVRHIGDFQLAEDALQEAMESALTHWSRNGVPFSPMGWLLRVAQRKAIDRLRRDARHRDKVSELALLEQDEAGTRASIPDHRLAMIFTCCHPALEEKSRIALTLRTLGGLTTREIAGAFLDREATMGQRLSRAKAKIKAAGIPFAVPEANIWAERLHSVLTVVYLIFNAGYSSGGEGSAIRVDLCEEAIFLARLLDELSPGEAEVEGLLALLLLSHGRRDARTDARGQFVPLGRHDVSRWDRDMLADGEAVLDRALTRLATGRFQIQAAISALHVQGGLAGETDWRQILLLYDALHRLEPTPVVALNRAVALAEVAGAEAGLGALDTLEAELSGYQPYHAARANLLSVAGRATDAERAYERAIELCEDDLQKAFLLQEKSHL